jgi:pimeloyl-ACP methyl ester carboxylesterase
MAGLDYRNGIAGEGNDQIDVRVVTHPDGSRAYIVDIPGTKVWDAPGQFNPNLNDLGTNIHVLGGDATAREQAIAEALHRAGASPTDPVMLIGHSQGGMVAAQAAHDTATGAFDYNVTHVLTAGSPIARADVPPDVQVLALENSHDIVPHLDAADNPDRPNVTTVTFDNQYGNIGDNHNTNKSYVPAAQTLDGSTDPSVRAYRDSADAFLSNTGDGTTVQTDAYQLSRTP